MYVQQLVYVYVDWMLAGSCQQPVNIKHMTYTNCYTCKVVPPDDEQ